MTALLYLMRTNIKNYFVQLVRKPARLVGILCILLMLGLVIVTSTFDEVAPGDVFRPVEELYVIVLALYMFGLYSGIFKGLSTGGSFFTMADVNLLFTSPVSPKKALMYGLVRQAGTTLLMSFFILYQAGTIRSVYNQSFLTLLLIFAGFVVNQLAAEVVAVVVYSVSSGNEARRKRIKTGALLCLAPPAVALVWVCGFGGQGLGGLVTVVNSRWVELYPFSGWAKGALVAAMNGDPVLAVAYIAGIAAVFAGLLVFLRKYRVDYYEDVMQATELVARQQERSRTGNPDVPGRSRVRSDRADRGLRSGRGASTLFWKHILENSRGGFWLFDLMSLIQVAGVFVFALIMRDTLAGEEFGAMTAVFVFAVYFQLLTAAAGRWSKELFLHYIFLIPAAPFKKLFWACADGLIKSFAEGAVLFLATGLLVGADPLTIAICILARVTFSLLFIAGNVLMERAFGGSMGKGLIVFLYFIIVFVLCGPGIAVGVAGSMLLLGSLTLTGCLVFLMPVNILIACGILAVCRNILHNTDITAVKN